MRKYRCKKPDYYLDEVIKKVSDYFGHLQRVDKTVYTLADVEKLGQILRKEIRRRTGVR